MRLILITQEQAVPDEAIACRALFDAGLQLLHLRKPAMQQTEMAAYLAAIPPVYHHRIVLHDHFSLAGGGIKRIHLNSRNPHPPADKELIISCSCHTVEELEDKTNRTNLFHAKAGIAKKPAVSMNLTTHMACSSAVPDQVREQRMVSGGYEYLFLSPIFNSVSKQGYNAAFPEKQLISAAARGIINPKVIALGGIGKDNLEQVAAWRFGGVALIGNIWGDYATTGDIRGLLKRYKELQTICDIL
ncbi:MAG: thiamine phosphate synthase [Tannerellaceae bacterium]|nr:thiamine phosphate synthase [Tannerellaceae bacterium]